MNSRIYDILGVGVGPFNLGLSALLSSHETCNAAFLERKPEFRWHEGLMLPGTTLQVPFLADLVTMADPCHPLSFLNYLHHQDRLYKFYFYENFHVPRQEYNDYCKWAAMRLPSCRFGEAVTNVQYDAAEEVFRVESRLTDGCARTYRSRDLAVGIGTAPHLPDWARSDFHVPVVHAAEFAGTADRLAHCRTVTVIGSGQSAAECVLALMDRLTPERVAAGASVRWITRSVGFHPMEYSKLGQECFTPAYMSHFQTLSREKRIKLHTTQDLLYKGISVTTIARVFDLLYERSIGGRDAGLSLVSNCEIEGAERHGDRLLLKFRHRQLDKAGVIETDGVVAATGYRHTWPNWWSGLKDTILETDAASECIIDKDFTARRRDRGKGRVFVQNAEIFQHGVGSPDLGIGAYRNAVIANRILGRDHYRLCASSAFQTYGLPDEGHVGALGVLDQTVSSAPPA